MSTLLHAQIKAGDTKAMRKAAKVISKHGVTEAAKLLNISRSRLFAILSENADFKAMTEDTE